MPQINHGPGSAYKLNSTLGSIGSKNQSQKTIENYKTDSCSPLKKISTISNPQFAFKTDTNELTENALAQYMQF